MRVLNLVGLGLFVCVIRVGLIFGVCCDVLCCFTCVSVVIYSVG